MNQARLQLTTLEYQQDMHFLLKRIVKDTGYFVMRRFIVLENTYGKESALGIHCSVMQGVELERAHECTKNREFYAALGGSNKRCDAFYSAVCVLRKKLTLPDHP